MTCLKLCPLQGISTYDYILAMKEENQIMELESLEDSDFTSSDDEESVDLDSSQKPAFISRFTCKEGKMQQVTCFYSLCIYIHYSIQWHNNNKRLQFQNPQKIAIRIDGEAEKKQGFRASIDPWKLINLSREKALLAAEKAREKLVQNKAVVENDPLKPLPLETRSGPVMKDVAASAGGGGLSITPLMTKGRFLNSPRQFSSPRRRLSCSPVQHVASPKQRYRSDFDLKLTQVSRELETYISRQVLCSVLKKDRSEASPR